MQFRLPSCPSISPSSWQPSSPLLFRYAGAPQCTPSYAHTTHIQLYFTYRVKVMARRSIMPWVCACFGLVSFGFSMSCGVGSFLFLDFATFERKFKWETILALGARVATDTTIAGTLCLALRQSKAGVNSTNAVIDKIIAYAITTGLITRYASRHRPSLTRMFTAHNSTLAILELICVSVSTALPEPPNNVFIIPTVLDHGKP